MIPWAQMGTYPAVQVEGYGEPEASLLMGDRVLGGGGDGDGGDFLLVCLMKSSCRL